MVQYHMGRLFDLVTMCLLPLEASPSLFTSHLQCIGQFTGIKKVSTGLPSDRITTKMVDVFLE